MMTKQFSWLHLSDLHIGQGAQWLWPNFKATFLDDLRRIAAEAGPLDLIMFSGDLTQRGEKSEYSSLTNELRDIYETLDKLGQRPALFTVPGNHDLIRPPANDARAKLLRRWSKEPDVEKEFWGEPNNQYIQLVRDAFSGYMDWQDHAAAAGIPLISSVKGILPGDISTSIEVNGITVGLVGLNSSFLQLGDGDYSGQLVLSLRQLNAVTEGDPPAWIARNDINFLITHHPTSWLTADSQREFQTEIYPSGRFTAHFFGHMHDADLLTQYHGGDSGRKFVQSTSLFGMEFLADGRTERVHGYSIGKVCVEGSEGTWRLWPRQGRVNRKSGDRRIIPDHDNFTLMPGTEFQSEKLVVRSETSRSVLVTSKNTLDLAATVEETVPQWNEALNSASYSLIDQVQHLSIRPLQQQACMESIRQSKTVWLCSDWGLGRDGFIWSAAKRMNRDVQPIYRIDLGNYNDRGEFFTRFHGLHGCAFPEFCKALAAAGPAMLLFDESPVSIGDAVGFPIERDVEALAMMVRDFCPDVVIFLLSRRAPRDHRVDVVTLEPLDEADTRTYLLAHPSANTEARSARAVSEIHRRTDGLPGKVDRTLKTLRVVTLSELGPVNPIGINDIAPAHESIPMSLVKAVSELSQATDPSTKRTYLLLKVLAILPHGESLQRLKRIEHQHPIFPKHAEDLLDRDLIQIRASSTLIESSAGGEDRMRILVAPRPVRDYVLSTMSDREVDNLVGKATSLYFGDGWRVGQASLRKLNGGLTSDDGSLLENPHSLVARLLGNPSVWQSQQAAGPVLHLCNIYCGALFQGKYYRNCITVCRDILAAIPFEGFELHRDPIEILLAKSLRMAGEHKDAQQLLERLLEQARAMEITTSLLLNYALCLQSRGELEAIVAAKRIISLAPKSANALQAQSIILEMEGDSENDKELLKIEREARKRGFDTVANNLTLGRADSNKDDLSFVTSLRQVYSTAVAGEDSYNAARAVVKLSARLLEETGTLTSADLGNLIKAYQYFYGERFNGLFYSAHKSLWEFFEKQADIRNLLSLFRHSSFIWRLNGNDEREGRYVQRLIDKARQILTTDVLAADQNTAYFLVRARSQKSDADA